MPSTREALQDFSAVVVTGGSSGIGKSFIELVAKLNPALTVCNLSRRSPDIEVPQLKLRHFPCDLSQPHEIERAANEVIGYVAQAAPHGRVMLINNSGYGSYGDFPLPDLPHHLGMIDVNIRAVVQLTALLLPLLRQRGGAIVSVASIAAFQPTPYMGTYGATKAFVLHWSLALNEELRGSGVTTLAVCPGPTRTGFSARAGLKPGTFLPASGPTSDDVARAAIRALAAGRVQVTPGWKNKLAVLAGSAGTKPFAARVSAKVLKRFRPAGNTP